MKNQVKKEGRRRRRGEGGKEKEEEKEQCLVVHISIARVEEAPEYITEAAAQEEFVGKKKSYLQPAGENCGYFLFYKQCKEIEISIIQVIIKNE